MTQDTGRCPRDSDWCDGVTCKYMGITCPNADGVRAQDTGRLPEDGWEYTEEPIVRPAFTTVEGLRARGALVVLPEDMEEAVERLARRLADRDGYVGSTKIDALYYEDARAALSSLRGQEGG